MKKNWARRKKYLAINFKMKNGFSSIFHGYEYFSYFEKAFLHKFSFRNESCNLWNVNSRSVEIEMNWVDDP